MRRACDLVFEPPAQSVDTFKWLFFLLYMVRSMIIVPRALGFDILSRWHAVETLHALPLFLAETC